MVAVGLGVTVALVGSACGAPLPKPVPGQSPSAYSGLEVTGDRIDYAVGKVPDIVEEELEASGVPGAAVAVVHGGEVVLSEGFGVRSTETGEAVDPQTVFPLASLSKPVAATVVAPRPPVARWTGTRPSASTCRGSRCPTRARPPRSRW